LEKLAVTKKKAIRFRILCPIRFSLDRFDLFTFFLPHLITKSIIINKWNNLKRKKSAVYSDGDVDSFLDFVKGQAHVLNNKKNQ
jgi:hypothetical protein